MDHDNIPPLTPEIEAKARVKIEALCAEHGVQVVTTPDGTTYPTIPGKRAFRKKLAFRLWEFWKTYVQHRQTDLGVIFHVASRAVKKRTPRRPAS